MGICAPPITAPKFAGVLAARARGLAGRDRIWRCTSSSLINLPLTAPAGAAMVFVFEDPPTTPLPCFLVQVFITLSLTRLLGKAVSYAKQPRVIGEIIGGSRPSRDLG